MDCIFVEFIPHVTLRRSELCLCVAFWHISRISSYLKPTPRLSPIIIVTNYCYLPCARAVTVSHSCLSQTDSVINLSVTHTRDGTQQFIQYWQIIWPVSIGDNINNPYTMCHTAMPLHIINLSDMIQYYRNVSLLVLCANCYQINPHSPQIPQISLFLLKHSAHFAHDQCNFYRCFLNYFFHYCEPCFLLPRWMMTEDLQF